MKNLVILIGNLGSDPSLNYTQAGKAVANLSVATSKTWKDQSGEKQKSTEWHRVVTFGQPAEFCGEYLKKGMLVDVQGSLQTRKWQDQEGNDRYTTEIVAQTVQNLSPKSEPKPEQRQERPVQESVGDEIPF